MKTKLAAQQIHSHNPLDNITFLPDSPHFAKANNIFFQNSNLKKKNRILKILNFESLKIQKFEHSKNHRKFKYSKTSKLNEKKNIFATIIVLEIS